MQDVSFSAVIEVSRKKWGERMLKECTVSPVCSLAWQHCTLYSCNNITHSSSRRRLRFNTFIRHFYYLLLSFHSCFSPHTFLTFTPVSFFIAPLYIIFYSLPPHFYVPPPPRPSCWAPLWPLGSLLPHHCAFDTHFKQAPLRD